MSQDESMFDSHYSSILKLNSLELAILLFVVCLTGPATPCSAQVLYGSLTDTVTDPTGATVTSARVDAVNVATGVSQQGTTDGNGICRFSALLPGVYKITISAPNFSSQISEGVRIDVNTVRRVDAQLRLASQAQTLTVTAEAPLLQTDRSDFTLT